MKAIYRHTIMLNALDTIGTRALVALHYLLLALFMGAEQFGQISAWYSTIFLCLSISSSGIMTTLTLLSAHNAQMGTQQHFFHTIRYQWRFIVPLAVVSISALILLTPLYASSESAILAPLAFLLSLAHIAKKQLGHALKLSNQQIFAVVINIGYHLLFITLLCGWYWYYGFLTLPLAMGIVTICAWFAVGAYMVAAYAMLAPDNQKASIVQKTPNNHLHHIAIDMSKLLFSPNAIVLLIYTISGPIAAGFVKALHGASQLFLSSSSKLLSTVTHINYALSADQAFITRSLYWAMICGGIGISATVGCLFINAELCSYALQYAGSTAALLALFGTNQIENMLQFSLASRGQSYIGVAITLCAAMCIGAIVALIGIPDQMTTIILLFLGARCISLCGLLTTHRRFALGQHQ